MNFKDEHRCRKAIIHLDMDAFYPSVEVLDDPSLRGKPVIVGGSRERGVVSSDEAFLDVTGTQRLLGEPAGVAAMIKKAVFGETGLTVSAGVAPNKFVSKIASDIAKPDGLTIVSPDAMTEFLDPLPIGKMWGVGRKTEQVLIEMKILTFRDLRLMSAHILEKKLGDYGVRMQLLACGIDEREVVTEQEAKSIGHEETFMADITDVDTARRELLELSERVGRRMRKVGVCGRTVTLKVKYSDFKQVTRALRLNEATDDGSGIYSAVCGLLQKTQMGKRPVRLLGVYVTGLCFPEEVEQLSFFGQDQRSEKKKRLNAALDSLREKHGYRSIRPGALVRD